MYLTPRWTFDCSLLATTGVLHVGYENNPNLSSLSFNIQYFPLLLCVNNYLYNQTKRQTFYAVGKKLY